MIYWISVVLLFTIPSASHATLNSNGCPTQESMDINEMEPVGYVLLNIKNVNSIRISGNQPYFEIKKNRTTAQMVTKQKIDYEKVQTISFTIVCEAGTGPQSLSVTIFVKNTVDVPVKFSSTHYTTSMAEDIKNGSHVITVNIIDTDANFPNWTLTGSQMFALVRKDKTSAIIGANGEFDYERDPHTFNLTVFAEIPENKTLSGSARVTVRLTDVDNLPPKFKEDVYKIDVPENTKAGILDAKIHAYDQDSGINASVKYRTVNEDQTSPFRINETSGSIVITNGTVIDREKKDFYVILVQACQVDKPTTRTNAAIVEISITDVNDNAPRMSKNTYQVTIAENTPHITPVIQVSAEDLDEGENKKFEFHMVRSNTAFVIDNTTGLISVNNTSLLDREQKNNFTLQVYAKETSTKEHKESSKSKVTIKLTDENDNNPQFSLATYNFTIKKTAKIGEPIGNVNATDIDEGINGQITYEFSSDDKDKDRFKLDSTSGSITVLQNLSSHFLPEYKFLLRAHDNAADKNKRRQSSATVFITVENVNTQAPRFVPPDKVSVDVQEDVRNGSFIAKITAEDPDLDSLTYSFSSTTNTAKLFVIDRSSGEIRLNGQLDREKAAQYDLTIRVFDGNFTTNCILNVRVLDVNDNSPRFSRNYSISALEEQDNILVCQVNAMDNDEGENRKISYRILEPWSANFTIDNSGKIHTLGRLDRDILYSSGICELEVEAVDGGTPALTGECLVTVNVVDINDNGPQFLKENVTLIFDELTTPIKFFTAQATDKDPESVIVYKIKPTQNVFKIDNRTGELSAMKSLTMEESDNGFFQFDIVAGNNQKYHDTSIHDTTQHMTIELKDVNNHFPKFDSNKYNIKLLENKDLGLVYTLNATDADKILKYNTVTYSITSGNEEDKFFIERSTGNLYLKRHLDYENTTKYSLTIKASDGQPNVEDGIVQGSNTSVIISVQNVNDNRPVFTQDTTTPAVTLERHDISCDDDSITAFIPEDLLPAGVTLEWRDRSCSITENSTHFVSTISHSGCGTSVNMTTDSVIFENEITVSTSTNVSGLVDFGGSVSVIPVRCVYPRKELSVVSYLPNNAPRFFEKRTGHFKLNMELYETSQFQNAIQNLPAKVRLQSDVNIRVSLSGNLGQFGLRLEKCMATKSPAPYDVNVYRLIEHGCPVQTHVKILNSPTTEVRFTMKAFEFTNSASAEVYIHCEASVCAAGAPECISNCANSVGRRRRDLSHQSHLVSAGPVLVQATEDNSKEKVTTVLTGVFGVVALGAVVLAIIGWRRKPAVKSVDYS